MSTPVGRKLVVSLCGPSGAGKSHLAKALVAQLGDATSVRVPADYYLLPATAPRADYFARPLRYDWALLEQVLTLPVGTVTSTPDFDFATFQRRATTGGKPFVVRPVVLIDTIYPYPQAEVTVLLTTPSALRKTRIRERDRVWGTTVADRWDHLEMTRVCLEAMEIVADLQVRGTDRVEEVAASVLAWLRHRYGV